jgi:hypothetical protein
MHFGFEKFESQLLRKQNIAPNQIALGQKTPPADPSSRFIKLVDVQRFAVMNAIALAGLSADHIEIAVAIMLQELRGGQIRS